MGTYRYVFRFTSSESNTIEQRSSERGPPPPGVVVAARRMIIDPNDEPQYGERVPYVISRGEPGMLLAERAMDPLELLNHS